MENVFFQMCGNPVEKHVSSHELCCVIFK